MVGQKWSLQLAIIVFLFYIVQAQLGGLLGGGGGNNDGDGRGALQQAVDNAGESIGNAAGATTPNPTNGKYTSRATKAPPTEKGEPATPISAIGKNFVLSPDQISVIKGNCVKKPTGCLKQTVEAIATKKLVSTAIVQDLLKGGILSNPLQAALKATEILNAVQEAKRALYQTQGLLGIEPLDDGLWHKDIRLNLEQAQFIIKEVTGINSGPTSLVNKLIGGKKKRSSVFLESFPSSKWNMPIAYVIGSDLTYNQGNQVRSAIAEIQSKTCIRFYEDKRSPASNPHMLYTTYTSGYCGQSPLGNQGGVNTIWLNFNCDGGNIKATIIHETMHSLGVHHEHIRVDRDNFLTVDWNNIDPQSYDLFDGRPYVNSYSSYGVPYDYYSVMHYHAYVAALNTAQPNMIPKKYANVLTRVIGQRIGMSDKDADILKKMYCMNDCHDYHVWCGYWATSNYCMDPQNYDYMRSTCPKSCGFCPERAGR